MKRFISLSGGVESTTMCILYGKGAKAIWCDTGWEHKPMYDRMDKLEEKLKELHNGDFEIIRIKPSVTVKGQKVQRLQDKIERSQFMPSKFRRYCTGEFKIKPIDNFLKSQGDCELMIGFNSDEEPSKDRTGNFMKCKNVNYKYPLFEDGYSREMCEDILNVYGLHPNFPIYMKRGGCKGCIFKSIAEFKALYFFDRQEFIEVKELEEKIQDKRKKFFSISMSHKPMSHIQELCETEIKMFGEENIKSMYHKIKPSQSCGAFCHR